MKKQVPKQPQGSHYYQRSFDPQGATAATQQLMDEYQYSYPQNYDGQSTPL